MNFITFLLRNGFNFYIFLILFKFASCHASYDESITIKIEDGPIAGRFVKGNFSSFYSFQEIPYAAPPVGSLRFKEPQLPAKWESVLNTTTNTKVCVNFGRDVPYENEDCLYLNVYTPVDPRNKQEKLLPVLFWIHGGAFLIGSGIYNKYGPGFFMNYSIILVTINYRIGPLGFLSTEDNVIPGNIGLKDQNLALQWVQKNIKSFGGDPKQVTIMGQSAGSASVGYHVLSKKSDGLFRAAIMESGTPLGCWSLNKNPKNSAFALGTTLSKDFTSKNSSNDLLNLLRNTSIDVLKKQFRVLLPAEEVNCYQYFSFVWTPVAEDNKLSNAFITGLSHENLKKGLFNQVPVMIGFNSQEILAFDLDVIKTEGQIFDTDASFIVNQNIRMLLEKKSVAGTEMKQIYTNKSFSEDFAANVRLFSDTIFTTPISRHAYLHSKYNNVYAYQFSYHGKMGEVLFPSHSVPGAEGVAHSQELAYLFENILNEDLSQFPELDLLTQKRLLQMWTGFVKTNNPTSEIANVSWPTVTSDHFYYMDINSTLSVKQGPKKYEEISKIISQFGEFELDTY